MSFRPPSRRKHCSSSTRSSLACSISGISPISSRNSVPLSASSNMPALLRPGVGEGAFLVAEQLALEQRFRDGRAVDGDERLGLPEALVVQRLGDQVLARPVLPFQQNGGRLAGGHASGRSCSTSRMAARLGDDFSLHRRHLFGDVLDGGHRPFHFAVVVQHRRGADDHQALPPVVGVQAHHAVGHRRQGSSGPPAARSRVRTRRSGKPPGSSAHHLLGLDPEQPLGGPVHPGDVLVLVVEDQGVGKLVEDRLQDVRLLPSGYES